jgi:uncharacterized Zn finger protein (UPF0148 family)
MKILDRLQECWDKDDPTIKELRKEYSDCPNCGEQTGYWIPDGRFICTKCAPQAVILRWQNSWEAKERRRKRHERIVETENHPSVPLSVQLAQKERANKKRNNEIIKISEKNRQNNEHNLRMHDEREAEELKKQQAWKNLNTRCSEQQRNEYLIATPFGGGKISSGLYTVLILMNILLFLLRGCS